MRARSMAWALGGLVVIGCVLPEVVYDPAAGTGGAAAGAGGKGGSGGTGGTGGNEAGAGGDPGTCSVTTEREELCGEYCVTYLAECGDHEANTYEDELDCALTCACAPWPIGTISEPGSLECRRYHATLAASSGVNPHCFHSAEFPTMGVCECVVTTERRDLCDEYCGTYLEECSTHEANTYDNEADCVTTCQCAAWPIGTINEAGSLECRRYHATLAASSGVNPHCYHSAEFPTMGACEVVE